MAKKMPQICGFHCPNWTTWLFVLVTAWFTLSAFGIPVYGTFWSWIILVGGLCVYVCNSNKAHQKTNCPFKGIPACCGILLALVGVWFTLGAEEVLPTFGINLLYLVFFLIGLGLVKAKM